MLFHEFNLGVMFKTIAFISVLGAVVAPPSKSLSDLNINTSSILKPTVIPPTVLIDTPQSQTLGIDISSANQSQNTPSEGSRTLSKDESIGIGVYNPGSGLFSPPNNTPRSARRQELRFLTARQKKSGMTPAPRKNKKIDWDDWASAEITGVIPTSEEKILMPPNSRYTGPGPKLRHESAPSPRYNPVMLAPTQPDDDGDGLEDDSWGESEYLGLEDMPSTFNLHNIGPRLTPRVEKFMSARGGYNEDRDIDIDVQAEYKTEILNMKPQFSRSKRIDSNSLT
ncbi:hypothetical protein TWF694_009884 [Orbilia ellipsospora]|uniref:Uncharacterized protein n=1 Tax=Orbilia ellipsospora TaxID=2528407 RepID=A0AAV9XC66_9PEZI